MSRSTLSLTTAQGGGGWSTTPSGLFIHGKDPVPVVHEAGWAPGPVWTDAANLPGPSSPWRVGIPITLPRSALAGSSY